MPFVAVNKDALPNSPTEAAGCIKSFRPPKQAQVSRVIFQAQFRLSFALRSEAAQLSKSHRAQLDLRFGTFQSGGLSLRELWPPPVYLMRRLLRGQQPWTDV